MFRQIADYYTRNYLAGAATPEGTFPKNAQRHIAELRAAPSYTIASLIETGWASRARARGLGATPAGPFSLTVGGGQAATTAAWDHLIYAYLIENTRIYDIFWRVIQEYAAGERLGIATRPETYNWLRTTEELFYSYGIPFLSGSIVSHIRPDPRATRRNAYYRMFGIDLNHGAEDGRPYPYEKASIANREFITTFEVLLREVWRAIENATNLVGANPTDVAALANVALRLQYMLNERRGAGAAGPNLAREELAAVAALSWLELAVTDNTPVVLDLQAQATSPEERLGKIGARVGVPSHANSHSYFVLAPIVSLLLIEIEAGRFSDPAGARNFFENVTTRDDMMVIIDHWSRATGRNMKALSVAPTAAGVQRVPTPARVAMPAGTNGNGAATAKASQMVKV
jgi:hypothetical protein